MKHISYIFLLSLLLVSCARVGSPVGGAKDTLAPKFLSSNIDTARVNVPRDIKELRLNFDEYINLKDVSKNLIISPPIKKIKKIIPSNLANKYILIQWEDTLQANTTYSFNFGNAIADYNEGNVLPYFNYAFSTGDKIDTVGDLYTHINKSMQVNAIRDLKIDDIMTVNKVNNDYLIHLKYEQREPLIKNIDLVVTFDKQYRVRA